MTLIPDLNRAWTLAQATEALRSLGISLKPQAGGYLLNYATGGTTQSEYVTDDLRDALTAGYAMAEDPPAPPKVIRRRRRARSAYAVQSNGDIRLRRKFKKRRRSRWGSGSV